MRKSLGLLVVGVALLNQATYAEEFWSHKDWRVSADNGQCTVLTGGDGDDSFVLRFERGGVNASASYQPIMMRGYPVSIAPDDHLSVLIDGKLWEVDELLAGDRTDEWGDYIITAGLPGGLVPTLISALRSGQTLSLQKAGADGTTLATFSLAGLTANLLKAAEWCAFDADKLPES